MKIVPSLIIAALIFFAVGAIHAWAQTGGSAITVTTDRSNYSDGNQIAISGTVAAQLNVPISIVVKDPTGKIVLIGQVSPNPNNTYSTTVTAGGDLWATAGTYSVYVTYGSKDNTASTSFAYAGTVLSSPVIIQGSAFNVTYEITNGKVLGIIPTVSTKTLTIRIQPSGNGIMSVTLPRSLIDAKNNGQDAKYTVEEAGKSVSYNETRSDTDSRTLAIPFESNSTQITILGTQIVPEFETISILVLGISMTISVFYVKIRFKLQT